VEFDAEGVTSTRIPAATAPSRSRRLAT